MQGVEAKHSRHAPLGQELCRHAHFCYTGASFFSVDSFLHCRAFNRLVVVQDLSLDRLEARNLASAGAFFGVSLGKSGWPGKPGLQAILAILKAIVPSLV